MRSRPNSPLFILEVASASTVGRDVGDKRVAYAMAGVREYMLFDPGGVLSTPLLAWRLEGTAYVPWHAAELGRWRSAALGIDIAPDPPLLAVWMEGAVPLETAPQARRRIEALEREVAALRERLCDEDKSPGASTVRHES